MSSLQQVVGEPLSEEARLRLAAAHNEEMQRAGEDHEMMGNATPQEGGQEENKKSASAKTSTASSASSATSSAVKETPMKQLVRRRSDGHKRDLTNEFERAEDEELVSDEIHNARTAQQEPPQQEGNFWEKMNAVLD